MVYTYRTVPVEINRSPGESESIKTPQFRKLSYSIAGDEWKAFSSQSGFCWASRSHRLPFAARQRKITLATMEPDEEGIAAAAAAAAAEEEKAYNGSEIIQVTASSLPRTPRVR